MIPAVAHLTQDIDGAPTHVLLQSFVDRILILITQLGKVGNLVQASMPSTSPLLPPPSVDPERPNRAPLPPPPPALELTFLLGSGPSDHLRVIHSLYTSQVATLIWSHELDPAGLELDRRPVVVGIALRSFPDATLNENLSELERDTFHSIMDMIRRLLQHG